MKQEKLLQIFDGIDEGYLASAAESMSAPPKKHTARRLAVMAASLLLAIGILISVFPETQPLALPVTEHRICGEALCGPIRVESGKRNLHHMEFGGRYINLFNYKEEGRIWYLAVEASVIEILPHLYEEPKTGERYHILKMRTHGVLSGENIPDEFYFRLEESKSPALDGFDRLILGIRQTGIERYAMHNVENGQMETFSLLFESSDPQNYTSVIAMTEHDGVLCVSNRLAALDGWSETEDNAAEGTSSEEVRDRIRAVCLETIGEDHTPRVYTSADFYSEETAKAFEIMASAKNAVFVQTVHADGYGGRHITFTKYLGGFETSDQIEIFLSGDGNAETELIIDRITEAEETESPALAPILRELTDAEITPPHTYAPHTMEITHFSMTGWYDKSEDGTLRALIKLCWYLTDGNVTYLDDLYLLVAPDGSYTSVEREKLKEMIGNDKHIENAEYNVPLFFNEALEQIMPITVSKERAAQERLDASVYEKGKQLSESN